MLFNRVDEWDTGTLNVNPRVSARYQAAAGLHNRNLLCLDFQVLWFPSFDTTQHLPIFNGPGEASEPEGVIRLCIGETAARERVTRVHSSLRPRAPRGQLFLAQEAVFTTEAFSS